MTKQTDIQELKAKIKARIRRIMASEPMHTPERDARLSALEWVIKDIERGESEENQPH